MTLSTITISTIDYQAYASVVEADAYLAVDPTRSAKWATLTTDQRGTYLVAATRRLDLLGWVGAKTGGASQELQWPRTGVAYPDGTAVATDAIPLELQNACCLLAGSIALDTSNANFGSSANNNKRIKAGSAEIEYFRPSTGTPLQDETAFNLVKIFFAAATATSASTGAYAPGSCETSTSVFADDNPYGLTEGYP